MKTLRVRCRSSCHGRRELLDAAFAAAPRRERPWTRAVALEQKPWLRACCAHAAARCPPRHRFRTASRPKWITLCWKFILAWMMSGHSAGKIPPTRACGCRVIATVTDLVCASVACAGSYSDILGEARREQLHAGRLEAQLERARPHGGSLGAEEVEGGSDARVSIIARPTRLT